MGRKTKITREMILDAAYELLDEEGIGGVAIKSIASKLGCSTQPVSWQFGSMNELKKELLMFTSSKMRVIMGEAVMGREAIEAFFMTGVQYIALACDHPNVFRFLCVDDPSKSIGEDLLEGQSIFSVGFSPDVAELMAATYKVPEEEIATVVRDVVIYTHGLAVMMMYDSYKLPKKIACEMVFDVGTRMIASTGIEIPNSRKKAILKAAGIS